MIFEAWPWASTRLHLAGFMWRSCHSHIGAGAQLLNYSSLEGVSVTDWGPPVKLLRTLAFLIPGTSLKNYLSGVLNEAIFPSSELVISTSSFSPSSSPLPRPPCPQKSRVFCWGSFVWTQLPPSVLHSFNLHPVPFCGEKWLASFLVPWLHCHNTWTKT